MFSAVAASVSLLILALCLAQWPYWRLMFAYDLTYADARSLEAYFNDGHGRRDEEKALNAMGREAAKDLIRARMTELKKHYP